VRQLLVHRGSDAPAATAARARVPPVGFLLADFLRPESPKPELEAELAGSRYSFREVSAAQDDIEKIVCE
jgi:hypothetical protein